MLRNAHLIYAFLAALLLTGCGNKQNVGSGDAKSMSDAMTSAFAPASPTEPQEAGASPVPDSEPSVPESDIPAVSEDDSKTPRLTVGQFLSNPALIDRKFSLRQIEVSGIVIKTGRDETAGGMESAWLGSKAGEKKSGVICRFSNSASFAKVTAGKDIVIRGRLGRNMAQALEDCDVAAEN